MKWRPLCDPDTSWHRLDLFPLELDGSIIPGKDFHLNLLPFALPPFFFLMVLLPKRG